jgi:hypothetical protein
MAVYAVAALSIGGVVIARLSDRGSPHQVDVSDCISRKSNQRWVGSSGITLEKFCDRIRERRAP